jgi:ABC-2 type transport system permease protein
MLADAFRAETYRLSRNRVVLFWTVLFLPILGIVMGAITSTVLNASADKLAGDEKMPPELMIALSGAPMNMASELVSTAANVSNPLALLFLLIGAATLYTGDYRWETWRLISARNGRVPLLLGKVLTFAALALVAMIVLMIGASIEKSIGASVLGRPMTFDASDDQIGQIFALFGLSGLRILQVTMLSLLAGVLSRSLLAALFVPVVVSIAQIFAPFGLAGMGLERDGWLAFLINPGQGFDVISAAIQGGPQAPPSELVVKGWVALLTWTIVPLAAALAWFRRQDLSKE